MYPEDDTWLGDDGREYRTCWQCGGEGFIDGECTCMDDCCCCLEPEPPVCDICRGTGSFEIKREQHQRPSEEAEAADAIQAHIYKET